MSNFKSYVKSNRSLLVFSHNDLLFGNIVYNQANNSIKFIDYEFSHVNYQAFDIGNHFNKFAGAGLSVNYSLFPSRDFQIKWLRIYLESFYSMVNSFYEKSANNTSGKKMILVDEKMVNQFYEEVNMFTLLSHFLWTVWSLVQAQSSLIEFDFRAYANILFNEYSINKSTRLI